MTIEKMERESKYFHPARTQPFIITLFQSILAFKRVCKRMKLRLGRNKRTRSRKATLFRTELSKAQKTLENARKGKILISTPSHISLPSGIPIPINLDKSKATEKISATPIDYLYRKIDRHLGDYQNRYNQSRAAPSLDERLDSIIENNCSPHRKSPIKGKKANSNKPLSDQMFSKTNIITGVEEVEEGKVIDVGEYLEGSTLYYGSTIALQARHGGFLSFNNGEIKASAHKVLNFSRFFLKKSEDLSDLGMVRYGDALWLQAGGAFVLGAQYGSLVDQKRQIQPSLISCKRQSMFKAQQYGRWIILNREEPVKTLGHPVCHLDRVILEQEWYFLASSSPYESNMYKSISNSDEAMNTKIDLFRPNDDCAWRIHLVSLSSEDKEETRFSQKILQDAKDQIDYSELSRYKKSKLLSSLSASLPQNLLEETVIGKNLRHKSSSKLNQEHLLSIYKSMSQKNFISYSGSSQFLEKVYGKDSPIPFMKAEAFHIIHKNDSSSTIPQINISEKKSSIEIQSDKYWDTAQKMLIPAKSWMELPQVMQEFHEKDQNRKNKAAIVIQKFMKLAILKCFNYERAMRKVDQRSQFRLEEKDNTRKKLILENSTKYFNGNFSSIQNSKTPQSNNYHFVSHSSTKPQHHTRSMKLKSTVASNQSAINRVNSTFESKKSEKSSIQSQVDISFSSSVDIHDQIQIAVSRSIKLLQLDNQANEIDSVIKMPRNSLISISQRPMSGSILTNAESRRNFPEINTRPKSAHFEDQHFSTLRNKLKKTESRPYGLPADIFEDLQGKSNSKLGIKFLKIMSEDKRFYKDIKAKPKS